MPEKDLSGLTAVRDDMEEWFFHMNPALSFRPKGEIFKNFAEATEKDLSGLTAFRDDTRDENNSNPLRVSAY